MWKFTVLVPMNTSYWFEYWLVPRTFELYHPSLWALSTSLHTDTTGEAFQLFVAHDGQSTQPQHPESRTRSIARPPSWEGERRTGFGPLGCRLYPQRAHVGSMSTKESYLTISF